MEQNSSHWSQRHASVDRIHFLDAEGKFRVETVTRRRKRLENLELTFFFSSFFARTDLKTMSERLKSRYYTTRKLFMADMQRIFTNCREYNPPESEYYKCANLLEKFFYTKIKEAGLIEK